jgi:dTDP-4-dehydrorhamnose reductase
LLTLITGAGGMLGRDLTEALPVGTVSLRSSSLDVTDADAVRAVLQSHRPDLVIHAAAYTDVDGCELHPDRAFSVNTLGARNVAQASEEAGAAMLYVSTDYVFDGLKEEPYREFDPTGPISVYGRSKLAGERMVRELCHRHYIVRSAWLFGRNGRNFVDVITRLGREKEELRVVADQRGSPTYTRHLAAKIIEIAHSGRYGVYHVTNAGCCSRFDFAKEILRLSGGPARLVPIRSDDYPVPAKRPCNSVLDNFVLRLEGMEPLPPWEKALAAYFEEQR